MRESWALDLLPTLRDVGLEMRVEQATGRHGAVLGPQVSDHENAVVQLSRRSMQHTYFLAFGPGMTFGDAVGVAVPAELTLLIASDHISEKTSISLRAAGIQYLDRSGNASIRFDDVLVDVRGRKRTSPPEPQQHRRATNPFSPRRAQVVSALLTWPRLARATTREIARAAGVSVGQAHETMHMLTESGHLLQNAGTLHGLRELLEIWTAAYPTGLGPRLALAAFRDTVGAPPTGDAANEVWVSGESAVPQLIRPVTTTLYVESLDPALPVTNRWRADGPPNVFIRRKFWSVPDDNDDGHRVDGIRLAPWPLVYADLMSSGDARQREVAQEWRDRHVGPDQM